jgi:hypothetical protein
MEIEEDHPGALLFKIGENGKGPIRDPLHSQMNNLGADALTLDQVRHPQKSHREEVRPEETVKGGGVTESPGDVEKKTIQLRHGGVIVKWETLRCNPAPPDLGGNDSD